MRVALFAASGLAVLAAGTAGISKPATVSQTADFLKAVAAIRADSHNYDKFKEPVRTGLDGQSFKVVLPFDSDLTVFGSANYDYKAGKLVLSLKPEKAAPLLHSPGAGSLEVLLIAQHTRSLGSYIGQNAFGATARVHSLENEGAGLALVSTPRPMKHPQTFDDGMVIGTESGWFYEQQLPPGDAKALALSTAVELQGTYTKVPWGDAGFCDFGGSEATISNPTDYYREACYLGAKVTRIAFVNESTGTVLKEWTEASDPAVGAILWGGIRVGMDKFQVKALYPAMTDYGSIEVNGLHVSVRMDDDQKVSAVEMFIVDPNGSAVGTLTQKFGPPVVSKCIVDTVCSAKWNINRDVSAYLSSGTQLVFQAADAPPPIGFSVN